MKKPLVIAMLGSLLVLLGISAASANKPTLDLGIDPSRLFYTYDAPSGDSGSFQMLPNTQHDPLILPCDLEVFGGQLDVTYAGSSGTVYPRVTFAFYAPGNTLLISKGYAGTAQLGVMPMDVGPMTPGTRQTDGYTPVDSVGAFRNWQFQPQDLPQDTTVRMHINVLGFADQARQLLLGDVNASNDAQDVWVKRECSCN